MIVGFLFCTFASIVILQGFLLSTSLHRCEKGFEKKRSSYRVPHQ